MGTEDTNKDACFRLGYRPALDGLRAVAILLVLLTHLNLVPVMYGPIGVNIFFVLSGFLITCLLVEEWDQSGRISLKAFYARRALRLLPALVAMLAAFLVYSHFCRPPEFHRADRKEALVALFYSTNWAMGLHRLYPVFLRHTWSLSIEEQFYILWPGLLLLLLRRLQRKSLSNLLLLLAVLSWLLRFLLFTGTATTNERLNCGLDTRADALLIGCALGVAISSNLLLQPRRLQSTLFAGAAISFLGLGIIGALVDSVSDFLYYAGWFLISAFAGIIVLQLNVSPGGLIAKALGGAPMAWLGRVSYGLYLWHYPIITALNETRFSLKNGYWWFQVMIVMAVTVLSYYLIERPFLRLKRRFQKAK